MLFENYPKADLTNILYTVLNNIDYSIIISDSDGKLLFVNEHILRRTKTTAEDWIGYTTTELVEKGFYDKSYILEAINSRKVVSGFVYTKDKKICMSTCRPVFNKDGSIKYVVTISIVTELFQSLVEKLKKAEESKNLYLQEIEFLRKELALTNQVVFASKEMNILFSTLDKIAPVNCPVLITGESGVGKEVIAKSIHQKSNRKNGPFVPVCVASIPSNLLESELFGYEEGAFTGSNKNGKPGLIELANRGTLFLDELGDIPFDLQVKLLRVLDTYEITKVGSVKPQKIDFRIIAATNKDIYNMAANGKFRDDLLYRLSVVNLNIKPLRERVEDIVVLSEYFLNESNKKYGYTKEISPEGYEILKSYKWPGNVRQLRNVIERLSILSLDDVISANEITQTLQIEKDRQNKNNIPNNDPETVLKEYSTFERERILNALKECNGNKSKAAKILGITRTTLYKKLESI